MPSNPSIPKRKPPDLTRRFRIQLCFPDPDEANHWDTITSFHSPMDALHRCSECVESVKDLLDAPHGRDLDEAYVSIRIWDAEAQKFVLWEDESGALHNDPSVFEDALSQSAPAEPVENHVAS